MTDPSSGDYELPFDSDVEVDDIEAGGGAAAGGDTGSAPRPAHLRPTFLLLVGVGGAAGTLARFLLQQAVEPLDGVPIITVLINVAGAFLLGLLLESLVRRGEDLGRRRVLRLLLGTGMLGGFTTYSAFAVDTVSLLHAGEQGLAVAYALGTVLFGAAGSILGIVVGARANRNRADRLRAAAESARAAGTA